MDPRIEISDAFRSATSSGLLPAVSAAATHGDRLLYEGSFGVRNIQQPEELPPDPIYWLASMTKAVTSAAAMRLVEQGKLTLEGELGKLVPELAAPKVLVGFDRDGIPQLRPARRPITLEHLLNHTSGLSYDIWNGELLLYSKFHGMPSIGSGLNAAIQFPLLFDPGERWEYGVNHEMIGKLIEACTGERLNVHLHRTFFEPIGMKDTAFILSEEQQSRLVQIHQRTGSELIPLSPPAQIEPEVFMGGAALFGTAQDYLEFIRMFLHAGKAGKFQILQPKTIEHMFENRIGDLEVTPLRTARPELSHDAEFFPGMKKKWGLGFLINTEQSVDGRSAGSVSWAGLANTYFWIDRQRNIGGVLLSQVLPFCDPTVLRLFSMMERGVYALT